MSVAAVCFMSFCTVTWVDMNIEMRNLVMLTRDVSKSWKEAARQMKTFKEEMETKYAYDFEVLLESSVDRFVNPILEDVQRSVNDANSDEHDVQHCYNKAARDILRVSNNKFKNMLPCLDTYRDGFDKMMENVDGTIKMLETEWRAADKIISSCRANKNVIHCIETKASRANRHLHANINETLIFERTVRKNYDNLLSDTLTCVSRGANELRAAVTSIQEEANKCIK